MPITRTNEAPFLGEVIASQSAPWTITLYSDVSNYVAGTGTLTTTANAAILVATAGTARNYITEFSGSNGSGTGVRVDIKDGTAIVRSFFIAPSGGGFAVSFPVPLRLGSQNALQMALGAAVSSVFVGASGYTAG